MIGRGTAKTVLAAGLIFALVGIAAAQANVQQSIRYGEIVVMEPTIVQVKPAGSGQVGATVGAVAGYALTDGRDRWLGALVGGVLGGAAGKSASKRASKKKGWQLIVQLEGSGEEIGVQVAGKKKQYDVGDRVRLMTGPGGETQVSRVKS